MTAATVIRQPLKERLQRLQDILNLAIDGASDPDGCDGKCGDEECIRLAADHDVLVASFRAIDQAPDEAAAMAIYIECWLALAGIPAPEWDVVVKDGGN